MSDPTNYAGNSKKAQREAKEEVPEKKIVKIVQGEVGTKKTGVGDKFKSIFLGADMKGLAKYTIVEVLVPDIRNVVFDFGRSALEQFIYGSNGRRAGGRLSGNTPYHQMSSSSQSRSFAYRGSQSVIDTRISEPRTMGPLPSDRRSVTSDQIKPEDRLFVDKNDAERILSSMRDVLDQYEWITHADFLMMLGENPPTIEHKWGWDNLVNVTVTHIREGWVIDFPPLKEIR